MIIIFWHQVDNQETMQSHQLLLASNHWVKLYNDMDGNQILSKSSSVAWNISDPICFGLCRVWRTSLGSSWTLSDVPQWPLFSSDGQTSATSWASVSRMALWVALCSDSWYFCSVELLMWFLSVLGLSSERLDPSLLQICSLMRGGIAERGGVRVGHRIIEINSQSVVATPHEKIVHILSNAVGEVRPSTQLKLLHVSHIVGVIRGSSAAFL